MTWIINLAGLLLMALIVWWFWLARREPGQRSEDGEFHIRVADGVYDPATLHARVGQPLTLWFHRQDPSPCAEQVIFQGLDVSAFLAVGEPTAVRLTPGQAGRYRFTCQMQMYQGTLIVD
ncbi:hypothetical protein A11A3_03999 [Alcanivorax hongdengensis A-11-3]|uniref:EfeO-type cupredoxin-like domain-containing protein n=1 Tax=Alcanivorax hongdengensis A-11-3 TaxID=1177179 RepID=L0WI34_9GAMM|nr:cupredoxin domain-containing protein [Alcanivorax hongdengensis]EKF75490.1 hypothetical protein A11A3_03999 [Alcanivorax hongdengensis A-11-3]